MKCPHCNAEIPDNSQICGMCGKDVTVVQGIICPECGSISAAGMRFCSQCGAPLKLVDESGQNTGDREPALGDAHSKKTAAPNRRLLWGILISLIVVGILLFFLLVLLIRPGQERDTGESGAVNTEVIGEVVTEEPAEDTGDAADEPTEDTGEAVTEEPASDAGDAADEPADEGYRGPALDDFEVPYNGYDLIGNIERAVSCDPLNLLDPGSVLDLYRETYGEIADNQWEFDPIVRDYGTWRATIRIETCYDEEVYYQVDYTDNSGNLLFNMRVLRKNLAEDYGLESLELRWGVLDAFAMYTDEYAFWSEGGDTISEDSIYRTCFARDYEVNGENVSVCYSVPHESRWYARGMIARPTVEYILIGWYGETSLGARKAVLPPGVSEFVPKDEAYLDPYRNYPDYNIDSGFYTISVGLDGTCDLDPIPVYVYDMTPEPTPPPTPTPTFTPAPTPISRFDYLPSAMCSLDLNDLNSIVRPYCGPGTSYELFDNYNDNGEQMFNPQYIDFMWAYFRIGNMVYVQVGYDGRNDNTVRYGFFKQSSFRDPGWSSIPEYTFAEYKSGTMKSEYTPSCAPSEQGGRFRSCKLKKGAKVKAYMQSGGWYLCSFDTSGKYGTVYLWIEGKYINWQ